MTAEPSTDFGPWRLCVAPMMDWTDRHCRYFLRLISRRARLYTEMVTTGAILRGDRHRFLRFHPEEQPLALQLGGSEPDELARCAEIGAQYGYAEINLNCGCPSDRVQEGRFGACLMREPARVAAAVAAMRSASGLPVTVKTRIGVDESEDYVFLRDFVSEVAAAGCDTFVIHARKAWLKGLSPKENRELPPLDYPAVYRLKREFPQLTVVLNGGLRSLAACRGVLQQVDGVMLGREAYENPYVLAEADAELLSAAHPVPTRAQVLRAFVPYAEAQLADGALLGHMVRHILGLYRGQPGGRAFRRVLSEGATIRGAGLEVIMAALDEVEDPSPDLRAA